MTKREAIERENELRKRDSVFLGASLGRSGEDSPGHVPMPAWSKQADEEERHFVVSELLAEADTWTGVEGEEDERVGEKVLETVVQEAVGVEYLSFRILVSI